MARGRMILAICLALILVNLPVTTAWSVDPSSKDMHSRGGLLSDGAGDSGHPWDDGSNTNQPPDSSTGLLTAVSLTPITIPSITSGGAKWIGSGLIYLLERVRFARISEKARYSHRK